MEIHYAPSFLRSYKKLSVSLQLEVKAKIALFRDADNHTVLFVHKLKGALEEQYSFRVNYKIRIVFYYLPTKPKSAYLITVGDHDIYD